MENANDNYNRVIARIKELGNNTLPPNSQLLLYGSRARGEAHKDSDWDLLIILDKSRIEQSDYDDVVYPFTSLGWDLGEMIIPVVYTKKEWREISFLPFHKNVEKDKILLL